MVTAVVCPKCKGKGYRKDRTLSMIGFFGTFGFMNLIDKMSSDEGEGIFEYKCEDCKGKGVQVFR